MVVTDTRRAPFDRVENGYDPHQVAAFAAEALTWKRDLATTRAALAETLLELEQHIALANQTSEREKAPDTSSIFEDTEPDDDFASDSVTSDESNDSDQGHVDNGSPWNDSTVDPLDAIFEMTIEPETPEATVRDDTDPEAIREQRVAAAAANLWKRRGVLTPPS